MRSEQEIREQINLFRTIRDKLKKEAGTLENERRIELVFGSAISSLVWVLSNDSRSPMDISINDLNMAIDALNNKANKEEASL